MRTRSSKCYFRSRSMPFPFLQLYADFLISCAVLSPSTAVPGPNTSCTELNPLSTYTSQPRLLGSLSFGGMWLSLVCYKNFFFQFWSKFPLKCFNIQNNLGTYNLYLFTVCVSRSLLKLVLCFQCGVSGQVTSSGLAASTFICWAPSLAQGTNNFNILYSYNIFTLNICSSFLFEG